MKRRTFLGAILGLFGLGAAFAAEKPKATVSYRGVTIPCGGWTASTFPYVNDDGLTEHLFSGSSDDDPRPFPSPKPGWKRVKTKIERQPDGRYRWEIIDIEISEAELGEGVGL